MVFLSYIRAPDIVPVQLRASFAPAHGGNFFALLCRANGGGVARGNGLWPSLQDFAIIAGVARFHDSGMSWGAGLMLPLPGGLGGFKEHVSLEGGGLERLRSYEARPPFD